MARTRLLKPGFFYNDLLAEIPPLGRLLFQGLWCHADREGRLMDRPNKLKAEILPYDRTDVDALLTQLSERGFINRYEVEKVHYIQVVNFSKHQQPHVKEAVSTIPSQNGHCTSTVQVPDKPDTKTPLTLNPSPLTLNLDTVTGELSKERATRCRWEIPALGEIQGYIETQGYHVDAQQFFDFYTSKGWMVGKNNMKDWRAAVRTWEKRNGISGGQGRNTTPVSKREQAESRVARNQAAIVAGLGFGPVDEPSQPDLQNRDTGRGSPRLAGVIEGRKP